MKTYFIEFNTDIEDVDVMVYSTCYKSPLGSIRELEKELAGKPLKVLFDLLLSNGTASNRYLTADFDGKKFDYNTFASLDTEKRTDFLRQKSTTFYQSKPIFLEASILTKQQVKMIEKGLKLR